jgi:dolichyl-phosphate-mannose-protein mannosyltransferase
MAVDTAPGVADDAPAPPRAPDERTRAVAALLVPLLLLAVAGTLRFYRLAEPDRIYFDETYYAQDAREYLDRGVEEDFAVHPSVGKWLLATGIAAFGYDSFGWRFAAAVAGTLTVLVVYLAGLRLFRHRGIAALAAFLLTVDGLAFTMSRIAMLDIFLALFVVTGFWLLLVDRDRQWAGVPPPGTTALVDHEAPSQGLPRRPHLFRWLAGVAFGLAVATKWSALLAIAVAGLFVLVSEVAWRRRLTGRWLVKPWRIVASGLLTLVVVPAVVYVASYAGWFANFADTRVGAPRCPDGACNASAVEVAKAWWGEQGEIYRFHRDLTADHPYRASARTWPTLSRPVAYYYESCTSGDDDCVVDEGNVAEILGIGNPAIWWLALATYPLLVYFGVRDRDWRAWAILAFLLGQYLPWLFASRPLFLFYMTPGVAFIALSLAYVAWRTLAQPLLRWVPAALAVVAVAAFLFWYPLYAGLEIPRGAWELRMLTDSWI